MTIPKLIKTPIAYYRFDVSKSTDAFAYGMLVEELKDVNCFRTYAPQSDYLDKIKECSERGFVMVETSHLFRDHFNTAECLRVHEWADYIYPNKDIKVGYYLLPPVELVKALQTTVACGYCGKQQPADKAPAFCQECLGSKYTEKKNLVLLRLLPISANRTNHELTVEEEAVILPAYHKAQEARIAIDKAEAREKMAKRHDKERKDLASNQLFEKWVCANAFELMGNSIYYPHTGKVTFGFRNPLTDDQVSKLLDVISELPFDYIIERHLQEPLTNF